MWCKVDDAPSSRTAGKRGPDAASDLTGRGGGVSPEARRGCRDADRQSRLHGVHHARTRRRRGLQPDASLPLLQGQGRHPRRRADPRLRPLRQGPGTPAGGAGPAQQRSYGVGEAYVAFAFANPMLYRLMFNAPNSEPGRYPELDAAGARARNTMTDHVRDAVAQGLLVGDPVVIGHIFWAGLHGLIMLELSGQLGPEPGFEALRGAMVQAIVFGLRKT